MKDKLDFVEFISVYIGVNLALKILDESRSILWIQEYFNVIVASIQLYVPLAFILIRRQNFSDFGITFQNWKKALGGFLILMGVLFIPYTVGFYSYHSFFLQRSLSLHWHFPEALGQAALFQLFFVALPEEFFFRGYLQARLNSLFPKKLILGRFQLSAGAILASVLFALSHVWIVPQIDRLAVFFPSLLFGWLRDRYQTLTGSVLFHAACNLWNLWLWTIFVSA
ncbi:MAG: CPBP family intramembrane metalloprotease [Deltaproteobacteria bacterium]|nr:CPBP family intramembrane metalloprotease [Deltaproteobacteria bacterium]